MCAAARRVSEAAYRVHGHFRAAILEPPYAPQPTVNYHRTGSQRGKFGEIFKNPYRNPIGDLLSAPKVPFLNSALPEECPGCLSGQNRIDGSALSGLESACASAKPTPGSVQRCASPSLASLGRWL